MTKVTERDARSKAAHPGPHGICGMGIGSRARWASTLAEIGPTKTAA